MRILIQAGAAGILALLVACAPPPPVGAPAPLADEPPPPLPERPIAFPPFQETQLANGLPIIVVEHPGQPVANVNLYIRSGTAADPAEQAGLAGMLADLLTKGTTTRSATQISETIEGVGGRLDASAAQDYVAISASVLSEHLPLAFELVSDVSLRPTFPEDEFRLTLRRTLSGLEAALGQPGAIAERRFLQEVYGVDHPYGVTPIPGTVQQVRRADLQSFHRSHFGADNALLVVSGNVDPAEVETLAQQYLGEWPAVSPAQFRFPEPPAREATRIYLVHRPGSVQSNIWVGHVGIRPDTPDFFALQVLNQVLGGGFVSRLMQILREEKGWTYGAHSRFTRPLDVGYFAALSEVRTEVTDSAVIELMRQLRRLHAEPVPPDEFEAAVSFLAGSFPLRIETPGQIASQIAQARLLGRPLEHVTEFRERIRQVTPADVQRVAREYVRPERAAIVVVGDADRILPGLEPVAPIVLYDVEGRPLQREELGAGSPR